MNSSEICSIIQIESEIYENRLIPCHTLRGSYAARMFI